MSLASDGWALPENTVVVPGSKVVSYCKVLRNWLGWQDSNLRITGSKPVALPLGYTPFSFARIVLRVSRSVQDVWCPVINNNPKLQCFMIQVDATRKHQTSCQLIIFEV